MGSQGKFRALVKALKGAEEGMSDSRDEGRYHRGPRNPRNLYQALLKYTHKWLSLYQSIEELGPSSPLPMVKIVREIVLGHSIY